MSSSGFFALHEHITHVGNPAAAWRWTKEQVIASIDAKTNSFYVADLQTGKRAYIGVYRALGKQPWLQTYADGIWTNNLLSLPKCPPVY
jgi:hypothetical protein